MSNLLVIRVIVVLMTLWRSPKGRLAAFADNDSKHLGLLAKSTE
ncbi:hypothetical protein [Pseudanabaena cinerea]|nr:hypothetical protein [Pseudanabaena cinerea]